MAGIKYIQLYLDYEETLADLDDAQLGRVIRAAMHYGNTGQLPQFSGMESLAFRVLKTGFDREAANYDDRVEQSRANGRKGGAPKGNQNARKQPKQPSGCFTQGAPKTTQTTETTQEEDEDEEDGKEESSSGGAGTTMTEPLKRLLNLCNANGVQTSPWAQAQLARALDTLGPELTEAIITNCLQHDARQWSYLQTALDKAAQQGLTSVEEYEHRHWKVKNNIVDRAAPGGGDFLHRRRPLRLKQEG